MARWINEDRYDAFVRVASANYGVPVPLIKAVIGQESAFRADAYRVEAKINDASRGLMQILYRTAQGVGYGGPAGDRAALTGLFDPATNITYGTAYLAEQIARAGGDIRGGVSAYNGGWNPSAGFGRPVTTSGIRVCLARDATGKCINYRTVPLGEYANQAYVNNVLNHLAYFEAKERTPPTVVASTAPPPLDSGYRHANESQADSRASGTPARSTWTQIREALTWLFNKLFSKWGNN